MAPDWLMWDSYDGCQTPSQTGSVSDWIRQPWSGIRESSTFLRSLATDSEREIAFVSESRARSERALSPLPI